MKLLSMSIYKHGHNATDNISGGNTRHTNFLGWHLVTVQEINSVTAIYETWTATVIQIFINCIC